jgi:excisionase family DNA binding protein
MAASLKSSRKAALPLKELPPLSKTAERFVREYPSQARRLVAAALEAAAVQYAPAISGAKVPETLKRFVVHQESRADLITITEAAHRLGISRTTAYDWIEKKRMIGWRATKAGAIVPAEQIAGPGELVKGLDRVLGAIGDARVAWRFLDQTSAFFDRPARPIDILKKGNVDAVLSAAEAYGEAFA